MARKPKAETAPTAVAATAPTNGIQPDDWIKHARQIASARSVYAEAKEEADAAKGKLNQARKAAKKAGMNMEAYDLKERLKELGEDEASGLLGETFRYCAWGVVPIGTQASLFAEPEKPSEAAAEEWSHDQIKEHGFRFGKQAFDRADNPYGQGTQEFVIWDKAWLAGQAANAPKQAEAEVVAPARRRRAAADLPPGASVN